MSARGGRCVGMGSGGTSGGLGAVVAGGSKLVLSDCGMKSAPYDESCLILCVLWVG